MFGCRSGFKKKFLACGGMSVSGAPHGIVTGYGPVVPVPPFVLLLSGVVVVSSELPESVSSADPAGSPAEGETLSFRLLPVAPVLVPALAAAFVGTAFLPLFMAAATPRATMIIAAIRIRVVFVLMFLSCSLFEKPGFEKPGRSRSCAFQQPVMNLVRGE
jgi:hypothetical protein